MGNPDYMNVQFETLAQAYTDLDRAQAAGQQTIADLERNLGNSLAIWSGTASDLYKAKQVEWNKTFEQMHAVLMAARNHTANAHDLYTGVERTNASIWG